MQSKHKLIGNYYADLINTAALTPGETLPSEAQMMALFHVSRDTVRKATAWLEHEGYILKQRGRESIVADRSKYDFPVSKITSFSELIEQQSLPCETIVEDVSILVGDAGAMKALHVDENTEVYRLTRVRRIDGERVILDKDLLLRSAVPRLTKEIAKGSLYYYLERELGLSIGVAKKVITVQHVTREDEYLLDLLGDHVVAVVTSDTRLADGTLFQHTESRHRIDKFRFIEYAHR